MIDREYTLNRLRSRSITPAEFNFERLSAPPLFSMFTPEDIQQLNYIATSPVYSAKLKEKYNAIEQIMNRRGFKKLVSGTNRVAYEPLFANNFIVKVAYDTVALKDSIREFYNQNLIKPFCTKVFEVSPCGTLGVFERVNPITSRKEYISMAADIYKLLSEFVIGQYIVDDIGTKYFQNIGFRNGFGAVILDFPYVYEVDGKKLYCNKPDYNDPTGYCNGPIDYDLGFNELHCKKCGATYKPFELAKKIEYNKPLNQYINESEDINMKITVSGGSKGLKKQEIVTGDFRNPVKAIKSNLMNKKVEKQLEEKQKAVKTVNGVPAPKEEPDPVVDEEPKKEQEKKIISPISINEEDVGKGDLGYIKDDDEKGIDDLLAQINNLYYYKDTSDEDKTDIIKKCCDFLKSILADNMELTMKMFAEILKKKFIKDETIKGFLDINSCTVNSQFIKLLLSSDNYELNADLSKLSLKDGKFVFNITPSIVKAKDKKVVYVSEGVETSVPKDVISNALDTEDNKELYDSINAKGLDIVNAVTVSRKDLFPKDKNGKIIVVKNDDGTYLTLNEKILAIAKLDDRKVDDIMIVGKDWYDEVIEKVEMLKEAPVGSLPEENEEASGEED